MTRRQGHGVRGSLQPLISPQGDLCVPQLPASARPRVPASSSSSAPGAPLLFVSLRLRVFLPYPLLLCIHMTLLKRLLSRLLSLCRVRPVQQRYALAEACLIGLVSALAALLLKQGIDWLGAYRLQLADQFGAGVALPMVGLILGLLAGWCIERLSPHAAGGGIAQIKAVLAQYPIPLSLRVGWVKLVGTILVSGAGLTLGRRGPTVHIGAALAAQLSRWVPTSPQHRRQMIAAGAAAGLAAGFNTPITGILFVVEELMRDISGLTLEVAILASFIGAVISRLFGFDDFNAWQTNFSVQEIPFYLLLGILAGILGALFNRGILFSLACNRRLPLTMPWRIGLAGLITGGIIALLPPFFRDYARLWEVFIRNESDWQISAITLVSQFFLTLLAYGSGAPGGLFTPTLVLGSALGSLVGATEVSLLGTSSAQTYALAGMGAFFSAVVRVPATAIVIVFELTANFSLVLPLMIGSVTAYIVAEKVHRGSLYQHLLAASGIELDDEMVGLTASDVMRSHGETLSTQITLDQVRQTFSRSSQRGFPVVEDGKLLGIVTQSDLAKLATRAGRMPLSEFMTTRPITINPRAPLREALYLFNRYQLSHLPVTEGRQFLGMITRSEIIQAEINQMSGEAPLNQKPEPSYLVYQTRAPAVGRGTLVLPLSNPETAPALLDIATAIARKRQSELECVQVLKVHQYRSPAQTRVDTSQSRKLLRRAERVGRRGRVSVHTQVRVAHNTAQAIMETIAQRQVSMMIMGWKGSTSTPARVFGNVVDTLIRQAHCDLVLVKLGENFQTTPHSPTRWLIPIAGDSNAQRAIQLLPVVSSWTHPSEFLICQVYPPNSSNLDTAALEEAALFLSQQLDASVRTIPVRSHSVSEAVIQLATTEECDVVLLGASREGLLRQAIQGNVPEAIARGVDCTVILVRGALD